jgi:hypothetical protein
VNQDQTSVRETGQVVRREATTQVRNLATQVRDRASGEARSQAHRLAQSVRQWSDDLAGMADAGKTDSPARGLVGQVADRGHRVAEYLEERGVGGAFDELQRFARRRPAAFLAGAVLAGFLIGRAAKAAVGTAPEEPQ